MQRRLQTLADVDAERHDVLSRRVDQVSERAGNDERLQQERHSVLAQRVDQVFERAGTEERLQKSVTAVIDGVLRDAEVTKHEKLSQAVAPLVVKTIKFELKNSQDEMVEALSPLTGRMVKQYVQTAMADLMLDINKRLGGGGGKPSELEARAKAAGVTVAELVLAESQSIKVDELFLVRRGSGDLVAHWERPEPNAPNAPIRATGTAAVSAGSNRDVLIAGYLAGITAFSEEAFDEKKGSLRSIDLNGERVFVRASPVYLLAARCSGRAPDAVEAVIDEEFVRVVADYKAALTPAKPGVEDRAALDAVLPTLAANFERRFAEVRADYETRARNSAASKPAGFGRFYAMAACVLLPLLAWGAWSAWLTWETNRVLAAAQRVITATDDLRGYPVQVDVERGGKALTVTGLMPTADARARLLTTLQQDSPSVAIRDRLGVLPMAPPVVFPRVTMPPDLTPTVDALKRELAETRQALADARRDLDPQPLRRTLEQTESAVGAVTKSLPGLRTDVAALGARVDAVQGLTPRMKLESFARSHAIFFANGVELLEEARAVGTLDQMAALISSTDAVVRVIGYTDDRGASGANSTLAQTRAERIAVLLADRGVPRERLVAVGRPIAPDLSRATGTGSANRRVEFEIGFIGEPTGR